MSLRKYFKEKNKGLTQETAQIKVDSVVEKKNLIIEEFESKQIEEERRVYESNLLNPEINRLKSVISVAVSSYLVWLRAQNNLAFNVFTEEEVTNFYLSDNISKPELVIYALKHSPENTIATIFDAVSKGFENPDEFLKMSASHIITPKKKTKLGENIDYAKYPYSKKARSSPTRRQIDMLSKDYGDMSLTTPEIMKMSFSEASDMIGVLFSKNVLWTFDEKMKHEKNARERRKVVNKNV